LGVGIERHRGVSQQYSFPGPCRIVAQVLEAVRALETDHVRMPAPVLSRLFHEPHAKQVQRGATTEVVLPRDRVSAAREKNPLEFEPVLAVPTFTLYRTDRTVEMGLTVTDDRAFVLAYDDDGTLRACVDSTDSRLREWTIERFERYREGASEVDGIGPF
jgi:predicted transcriptional regulator